MTDAPRVNALWKEGDARAQEQRTFDTAADAEQFIDARDRAGHRPHHVYIWQQGGERPSPRDDLARFRKNNPAPRRMNSFRW